MIDCTIKELRSLTDGAYFDDRLVVLDNALFSATTASYRVKMLAIMVVRSGCVELTMDSMDYKIEAGDIFVVTPNAIIDSFSANVTSSVMSLCVSLNYLSTNTGSLSNRADVMLKLSSRPKTHGRKMAIDNMVGYFSILSRKFMESATVLNEEIISSLVNASFYEVVGEMSAGEDIDVVGGYSSADAIFRKFLQALDSKKPRLRHVEEYAELLGITSKYLSAICRKKSGMTAIQVVNKAILSDAVEALRNDTKSISEVASELGFPNQSFFGAFIKKHTGLSPLKFRNRGIKKK